MEAKSANRATKFLNSSALSRPLMILGAASVLFGASSAQALDPGALPQNPNVVGGKATFSQGQNTLNVNQSSNRAIIDWRSFNIGSAAQTNFNQPNAKSIAVNRVNGSADPTQIEGGLHANGQVWILNPNGVFFGKTAHVDAAGVVASTANIDDKAFMAGSNTLQMTGADHGAVENQGNISVGNAGLAAFVAPSVRNSGTINATLGKVTLAAGTTYTLDLAGDKLVELGLGSVKAVVDQSGKIVNPGGTVALTAKAAGQVVNSVVNVSGIVDASSATKSGGTITLGGDNVTTTSTAQISADAGINGNGGTITSVANVQGNYAGSLSAKGGSTSGDGGKIETSGKTVSVDPNAKIVASAAHGANGQWLLDPVDLNIVNGASDGVVSGSSVTSGTIEAALNNNTDLALSTSNGDGGNGDISLQTAITAAGTGALTLTGRHLSAASGSDVITIGGALTLNVNAVNPLADTTSGNWINDALGMVGTVTGGTTVNLGAGIYAAGTTISKSNVTIDGQDQAKIALIHNQTGITIGASDVTVKGIEFAGSVADPYYSANWSDPANLSMTAIAVSGTTSTGPSNFDITGNNIHDVRTGIIVLGQSASGSITNNTVENTKGAILDNYNNASDYTISGNKEGSVGNEWGIVLNLNTAGHVTTAEPGTDQANLLLLSQNNGGLTVLDRFYGSANRTAVTVDAASTATAADDAAGYNGNGLGSKRQPLNTIQAGMDAVVAGGTVNIENGTYVTNGYDDGSLTIDKSLKLIGQSEAGVIIDARTAISYGIRVSADDATISNLTLWGDASSGGYGVKAQDVANLSIDHVTSKGAYKAQFDLNGVRGGTLNYVTADGTSNGVGSGSTKGAAIGITDSQDILLENSSTNNGAYGGVAIAQSNGTSPGGYSYKTDRITIASSNTFAESTPVYMEDTSTTEDFGTVTVNGFNYAMVDNTNANDLVTVFERTPQAAIDSAAAHTVSGDYVEGWTGTAGNNNFYVGTGGGIAMSINAAVNGATSGATINVMPGTYNEQVVIDKANLTLKSATAHGAIIDAGGGANSNGISISSTSGNLGVIAVDGFTVQD